MSNGNDPYGSYPPPGGAPPVHGQQPPQQPPPGQPVWDGQQWVTPPPPPQGPPPQQQSYPQGPPPQQGYQAPQGGYPQTPELDAATRAAIEAEEREIASRRGGDVEWFSTTKPKRIGETTENNIRVMQGAHGAAFFVKTWTHFTWLHSTETPGRKVRVPVTCARNGTPDGYQPAPCAVCERRDIAEQMQDKKTMDALKPKPRYFLNVLDLEDLQRHMKPEGTKAAIATFGPGLYGKLTKIMHAKGDISHPTFGRTIRIFTTKVGEADRDIRYDATDSSDPCSVPEGFEACELHDLKKFEPESDYQDIRARMAEAYPVEGAQPPMQGHQPPYDPPQGYQRSPAPPPPRGSQYQPPQPQAGYGQPQQPPPQQPPPQQGAAPGQPWYDQSTGQWVYPPPPQQPPQQPPPQGYQQSSPQGYVQQAPPQGYQPPPYQPPPYQPPPYQPPPNAVPGGPVQGPPPGGAPVDPNDIPF